jgi:hypothetical protein
MYYSVKNVVPVPDYNLILTFESGEKKVFDMKPYLEIGIFQELKNYSVFNTVKVNFDTIEWANEADIDPEILYDKSKIIT